MKHLTTSGYTCDIALQMIPNQFEFIIIAAERARLLSAGAKANIPSENSALITAIKEIEAGKYTLEDFNKHMAEMREESIAQLHRYRNRPQ